MFKKSKAHPEPVAVSPDAVVSAETVNPLPEIPVEPPVVLIPDPPMGVHIPPPPPAPSESVPDYLAQLGSPWVAERCHWSSHGDFDGVVLRLSTRQLILDPEAKTLVEMGSGPPVERLFTTHARMLEFTKLRADELKALQPQ